MWLPAVAVTKSPPFSDTTSAIASAFSRRSASPVRITTPVSMSRGQYRRVGIGVVDDRAERGAVDLGLVANRA